MPSGRVLGRILRRKAWNQAASPALADRGAHARLSRQSPAEARPGKLVCDSEAQWYIIVSGSLVFLLAAAKGSCTNAIRNINTQICIFVHIETDSCFREAHREARVWWVLGSKKQRRCKHAPRCKLCFYLSGHLEAFPFYWKPIRQTCTCQSIKCNQLL